MNLRIVFTDSPLFTDERKELIASEFQGFKDYLSGLGFEVPLAIPPIQINKIGGMVGSHSSAYSYTLFMTENGIDDKIAIRSSYASYIFMRILGGFDDFQEHPNRWLASTFLATYFVSSYSGADYSTHGSWDAVLWDLRNKLHQHFVDHALFYAVARFDERTVDEKDDFDKYFLARIERGLHTMDNPGGTWEETFKNILAQRNLNQPKASSLPAAEAH